MKGVTMIRLSFRPHAYCLGDESGETCTFDRSGLSNSVRAEAQRHVADTGHDVNVDVVDRTHYAPQPGGTS